MRRFAFIASLLLLPGMGFSDELTGKYRQSDLIDIPTAEVIDHYGYHVDFRFGREGALQNKTYFGVLPRLNLGFSLDGENILGTESARLNKPTMNIKLRFFDGKKALPALAIGYDNQGYVFNKALDEYEQREKGFFLVASSEFILPDLNLHIGGNIYDFDESNAARGFAGMSYIYEQLIGLMVEYDCATEYDERRINYGLKYFVTPLFTIDLAGRNIPESPGSSSRETERIVRLGYTGSF